MPNCSTRGYWKHPELSEEKWVDTQAGATGESWDGPYPVAFNQAYGRLYRTGDRGKWTAGQLEAS